MKFKLKKQLALVLSSAIVLSSIPFASWNVSAQEITPIEEKVEIENTEEVVEITPDVSPETVIEPTDNKKTDVEEILDEEPQNDEAQPKDNLVLKTADNVQSAPRSTDITSGLVLYLPFDDDTVDDQSGKGNNGTIVGSNVTFVEGVSGGKAVKIENPSSVAGSDTKAGTDYINFGRQSDLIFDKGSFSFSFWMKTTNNGQNNSALFGNKNYSSGNNTGFAFGNFSPAGNPTETDNRMNWRALSSSGRREIKRIKSNDDKWHHVAVVVDRTKDMTVYVDGKKFESVSISADTGTLDAGLDFVIGAGGNKTNALSNCLIDEFRVYNIAIDEDVISELYGNVSVSTVIDELIAKVNALPVSSLYTASAKTTVLSNLNDCKTALGQGNDAAEIAKAEKFYDDFMMGEQGLVEFVAVSDVHVANATDQRAKDFIKALNDMDKFKGRSSAFVNAGDNTNAGGTTASQTTAFYKLMDENSPFTDNETMILLGNHDVRDGSSIWTNTPTGPTPSWSGSYSRYMAGNARYMPNPSDGKVYHDKWLGGYHFIALNTENGLKDSAELSEAQLTWFEEKLAENAEPNKPIFVFVHQALNDTHWRSNILNGFGAQDAKVKEILAKYPQAVVMTGHVHNGFGTAEAIVRDYGTMVEIPSFEVPDIDDTKETGSGYYVSVYENEIVFRGRNFKNGEWLPEYNIHVTWPSTPVVYSQGSKLVNTQFIDPQDYADLQTELAKAKADFDTKYDQSVITGWNDYKKPAADLFHSDKWVNINTNASELSKLIAKAIPAQTDAFDDLRLKWREYLLGGQLDLTNTAIKTYVKGLDEKASEYYNDMVKSSNSSRTNLWSDLDMTRVSGTGDLAKVRSGNISTTYYRLRDIAYAYATDGTSLYNDPAVLAELIAALDHMYAKYYTDNATSNPVFGNWWHWEIGSPVALLNTAVVLYDDLTPAQIDNYTKAVNRFTKDTNSSGMPGSPAMTGANLIDKGTAVALSGILSKNSSKLEHVKTRFKTVFEYVTTGDGFYEDGSFIQHQALAFIGGYGKDLYEKLSIFFVVMKDSNWEISYNDGAENLVFDMIFEGIEPFFHEGRFMDMVSGRDIVRQKSYDKERGTEILGAIIPMRDAMPAKYKDRFDSMVKYLVASDENYFYENCLGITAIVTANDIMTDSNIKPRSEYKVNKVFGGMDKYVYAAKDYTLGLSIHSNRTYGHELINSEGKRTWNISDGMTYFYADDSTQYSEGYWATVDPTRLPGTTVEHKIHSNGLGDRLKNVYPFVGGSTIGDFAGVGMHYKAHGTANRNGAEVKKSWFVFGDEIVALGSSITSSTGNEVETILENKKIKADGSNKLTVDGSEKATTLGTTEQITSAKWLHFEGNAQKDSMGYYLPDGQDINVLKETRTGDWNDQGADSGSETNTFAAAWINHGANPTDAGYSYVILPNKTAQETADYAANNDIEILRNDGSAHAARKASEGVTSVNFWSADAGNVGGITVNNPASVTVVKKDGICEISIAEPTQEGKTIELMFAAGAVNILDKDNRISVEETSPFIKIKFNSSGAMGSSASIKFEYDENAPKELFSFEKLEVVETSVGTAFEDIANIPNKVKAVLADGEEIELDVKWSQGDYSKKNYGVYEVTGEVELPNGVANSLNLKPMLVIQVGKVSTEAIGDTFIRFGTYGTEKHHTDKDLVVKNDSNISYTRKSIIQFDATNIPTDAEKIYLNLEAVSIPAADFTEAKVYLVDSNWVDSTVTAATFPTKILPNSVATITRAELEKDLVLKIDVTQAVKDELAKGATKVSFEISISQTQTNNYFALHSLESTAQGVVKPMLSWSKTPVKNVLNTTNLMKLKDKLDVLDVDDYRNASQADVEALLKKIDNVLNDVDSEQSDVKLVEKEINAYLLKLRKKPA